MKGNTDHQSNFHKSPDLELRYLHQIFQNIIWLLMWMLSKSSVRGWKNEVFRTDLPNWDPKSLGVSIEATLEVLRKFCSVFIAVCTTDVHNLQNADIFWRFHYYLCWVSSHVSIVWLFFLIVHCSIIMHEYNEFFTSVII